MTAPAARHALSGRYSAACSAEAIGQVRLFTQSLAAPHGRLIRAANCISPEVVTNFIFKKNLGRARAEQRISSLFGPPTMRFRDAWLWRTLRYRDSPLPFQPGQGVEVAAVLVGQLRGGRVMDCPWGLYFTTHALGRLWERSSLPHLPSFDFRAVLLEAHDNLLAMPTATWQAANERPDPWILPAADGGFYIHVHVIKYDSTGDAIPFAVAKSFVSADMLFGDERAAAAAVLFPGEYPIGNGILLPAPLRDHAQIRDGHARMPLESKYFATAKPHPNVSNIQH